MKSFKLLKSTTLQCIWRCSTINETKKNDVTVGFNEINCISVNIALYKQGYFAAILPSVRAQLVLSLTHHFKTKSGF